MQPIKEDTKMLIVLPVPPSQHALERFGCYRIEPVDFTFREYAEGDSFDLDGQLSFCSLPELII